MWRERASASSSAKQKTLPNLGTVPARLLACPTHGDVLVESGNGLACHDCGFRIDPDGTVLSVNDRRGATTDTFALRLLRSPTISHIYEGVWRPLLVRAVSPLTDAMEDALVARHLGSRDGLTIADLCCGTARASRPWIGQGATVLGIDQSPAMLAEARRRCTDERLVLVRGDAMLALAKPNTFDAVLCFASLHLLERPEGVIAAGAQALKPGGILLVWALHRSGAFGPSAISQLASRLGLRPFPVGALGARVAEQGCEVIEDVALGAVNFVVGRRRE